MTIVVTALAAVLCLTAAGAPSPVKTAVVPPVPAIGEQAPDFTLKDTEGKMHRLADLKGKRVVLEWFNPDCPFVKYAHGTGPLKGMGARWAGKNVVWLAINSGAPGMQGAGVERSAAARKEYSMGYPVLIDGSGEVGRKYGAKTTPHMFVIDEKGVLVYRGALDNAPFGEVTGEGARVDYVEAVLQALVAGSPVAVAETKPYGCSVKYAGK